MQQFSGRCIFYYQKLICSTKFSNLEEAGCFGMLVPPKNVRTAAGKILKKYGFENACIQVKAAKYCSSYTPDDIQNSFEKLC